MLQRLLVQDGINDYRKKMKRKKKEQERKKESCYLPYTKWSGRHPFVVVVVL
jgi:hypothetical protein